MICANIFDFYMNKIQKHNISVVLQEKRQKNLLFVIKKLCIFLKETFSTIHDGKSHSNV